MVVRFHDVSFKSASGDVVETKIVDGVLAVKIAGSNEFIKCDACDDGWWWAGPSDYSIKIHGDDIIVSKGITLGGNPVLHKRA